MLGSRLKFLRTMHRATQQQLADHLNITRAGYSAYERGISEPDSRAIRSIANFYNVSADFLLTVDMTSIDPKLDELRSELWQYIATCDQDTAKTILDLFKKLDKR